MDISSAISVPYDLPYWTYALDIDSISPIHPLIGGILYLLFGHAPLVFKLFNVFLFAVSTIFIFRIQQHYHASPRYTFFYAFNPVFIYYSASMLKETAIILLVVMLLYQKYVKRLSFWGTGITLILMLLYRPYIAVIMMMFIWISSTNAKYRGYVITLAIISYLAVEYSIAFFTWLPDINEMTFAIQNNQGVVEYYRGVVELLRAVISSPIRFMKYVVYYFYNAVFQPIPWVYSSKYGAEGELARTTDAIGFNVLARWLYSFLHIYLITKILDRYRNLISKQDNMLLATLAFVTILVNAFKTGVERYQECVTLPLIIVALIMIPQDKSNNLPLRKIGYIAIYSFIFVSDFVIRQRSIFNIG